MLNHRLEVRVGPWVLLWLPSCHILSNILEDLSKQNMNLSLECQAMFTFEVILRVTTHTLYHKACILEFACFTSHRLIGVSVQLSRLARHFIF